MVSNGADLPELPEGVKTVMLPENVGIPAGRNHGVRACEGDIVLFLDDDGWYRSTDLARHVRERFAADPALAGYDGATLGELSARYATLDRRHVVSRTAPVLAAALACFYRRIPTGRLNTWLRTVLQEVPPPMRGGRLPRVLFATQASTRPPVIVLFTTGFLEHGYRRFLERRLREEFGFEGSPVRIAVRVREKRKRK